MKIADGVEMLEIEMDFMGNRSAIHPTLFYDDEHAVLVDVGMPGHWEDVRSAMARAGVPADRLDAVILTHQDIDHIGGIQDVLNAASRPIDVYAHAEDQPYIEGHRQPIKLSEERFAPVLAQLPEDARRKFLDLIAHPPSAKVTKVVHGGEVLPWFGGIEVIFTPGHTPGHISLYHIPSRTIIAGDATVSQGGKVLGPMPQATPDLPRALESLKQFSRYDVENLVCYHGGLCKERIREQLEALAGQAG
ncbi:MAG: MBL fold metallo-hydrolase [Alicyclobacillaceae bacterium]|nr:MBL fold metallo-hydrolase [Alicyclobacillaceae bacterium]